MITVGRLKIAKIEMSWASAPTFVPILSGNIEILRDDNQYPNDRNRENEMWEKSRKSIGIAIVITSR